MNPHWARRKINLKKPKAQQLFNDAEVLKCHGTTTRQTECSSSKGHLRRPQRESSPMTASPARRELYPRQMAL